MLLSFEQRLSDAPCVERVWRSRSHAAGVFLSVAESRFEMAVTRHRGATCLTLRGPETLATAADCPADGEWLGIRFKPGTFMPRRPPGELKDRNDATLPGATDRAFWLEGSAWEYPAFENADTFVARLVRKGIIVHDAEVGAAVADAPARLPTRTMQRRFLAATGLSHRTFRGIERARFATMLLREGVSILDTVFEAGYFDQAHLTRSLHTLVGQTPLELRRRTRQLSFLYKTPPPPSRYDALGRHTHECIDSDRRSARALRA